MKGTGILKGLGVTFKMFFRKKVTQDYPDVTPDIAARSHGSFELRRRNAYLVESALMNAPTDVSSSIPF